MNKLLLTTILLVSQFAVAGNDCSTAKPTPFLKKSEYRDYQFKITNEILNESKESIRIGVTSLEIITTGCADVKRVEFRFIRNEPIRPGTPEIGDLKWLKGLLLDLKILEDRQKLVQNLAASLDKIDEKLNEYKICKNESKPDLDGCSLKTGGAYEFKKRTIKGKRSNQTEFIVADESVL